GELDAAALAVEVRHVVLQLEEAERDWLGAGEGGEASPERVEERARLERRVHPAAEGDRQPPLRVAEDGGDQRLLPAEQRVGRARPEAGPLQHFRNARSVVALLGEQRERRLENAPLRPLVLGPTAAAGGGGGRHSECLFR